MENVCASFTAYEGDLINMKPTVKISLVNQPTPEIGKQFSQTLQVRYRRRGFQLLEEGLGEGCNGMRSATESILDEARTVQEKKMRCEILLATT